MEQKKIQELLENLDSKTLSYFFKLMSEEIRFQLIFILGHENELCVSDLATLVDASIATTSHHLQILKNNDLVQNKRVGKKIYYYVSNPKIIHFVNIGLDFNHLTLTREDYIND